MRTKKYRPLSLLSLLICALTLAGCTTSGTTGAQTQPTNTSTQPTQPPPTATSTPIPTCPANSIPAGGTTTEPTIVPSGWTTFTDTPLHYTIQYPSNWIVPNGPCPGAAFDVYNHVPVPSSGAPAFPPGGFHILVDPMPNPSQVSASALSAIARPNMPDGPPCAAYALQPTQVAGHNAMIASCPGGSASSGEGDPNQGITYFIPDGSTMLTITQRDLINGQPSSVLAQMVASLTFTN